MMTDRLAYPEWKKDPRFTAPIGHTRCGCATCGQAFSSVEAFDAHRSGPYSRRVCLDPAVALNRKGEPMFARVDMDKPEGAFYWMLGKDQRRSRPFPTGTVPKRGSAGADGR